MLWAYASYMRSACVPLSRLDRGSGTVRLRLYPPSGISVKGGQPYSSFWVCSHLHALPSFFCLFAGRYVARHM